MEYISEYKKKRVRLGARIAGGGEGDVYEIEGNNAVVAKIYNQKSKTADRKKKLEAILQKRFDFKEVYSKRIALPLDILNDQNGDFAGYVMPRVKGKALKLAFFSKKRLQTNYPNLTRADLGHFCLSFLDQVDYLHRHNILIGDINPLNVMVDEGDPTKSWLIDCDSFQVDDLPCPVGTDIFTPPNLQGVNFASHLRTKEDEYFSVAIMLFMILMVGKHPYSKIDGASPAENIKTMDFPYPKHYGSMKDVPKGPWGVIWSHFHKELKEAFYQVFKENKRIDIKSWKKIIQKYIYVVEKGYFSNDIFPKSFKAKNPVQVVCERCGVSFEIEKSWHQTLLKNNKQPLCADCKQILDAYILAQKAARDYPGSRRQGVTTIHSQKVRQSSSSHTQAPSKVHIASFLGSKFILPDEVYISRDTKVRGWETLYLSDWCVFGIDRDLDEARAMVKKFASLLGGNAIVEWRYERTTGSEGNYRFSIHHFYGRVAFIGKRSSKGTFDPKDIPDINALAQKVSQELKEKTKKKRKFIIAGWMGIFGTGYGVWSFAPQYIVQYWWALPIILFVWYNFTDWSREDWWLRPYGKC